MTEHKIVPIEPTHEMLKAMAESVARDDEGEFPPLFDLLDFSGENKTRTVLMAAYKAMLAAAPDTPSQEIDRLRADKAELEKEAVWIRNKLELPSHVKLLSGDITLAGTMHKIVSHAKGYVTYIEAFKCEDKQGEIARQSVRITSLQSENTTLRSQVESLLAVVAAKDEALEIIARGPLKPIPDPVAHSWEAFAKAWMAHATDCKFIAINVLKQKEGANVST